MTHPLRWSDSKAERVQSLVLERVDSLLRCPAERKDEATLEALSKLRSHVEAELEAPETLEWLRDLTDEELARQRAFMILPSVVIQDEQERKSVRERILAFLRFEAATNSRSLRGQVRARYATTSPNSSMMERSLPTEGALASLAVASSALCSSKPRWTRTDLGEEILPNPCTSHSA